MKRDAILRQCAIAAILLLGSRFALSDDFSVAGSSRVSVVGQAGLSASAFEPPMQEAPIHEAPIYEATKEDWLDPWDQEPLAVAPRNLAALDQSIQTAVYYRLDNFTWYERIDGEDVVGEFGPISTLGYVRRHGIERLRFELFGGTVAYDGFLNNSDLPESFHQSFGTNYLGLRGEYELLFEPEGWPWLRYFCGLGTRFWIRDLRNGGTSSGETVIGYQETWWTFYPYVGLDLTRSTESGIEFFSSMRLGATPLTYERVTYYDVSVYPTCGITGQVEVGVRYQHLALSAYIEAMTWGKSGMRENIYGDYIYQPASRMVLVGGKVSYAF